MPYVQQAVRLLRDLVQRFVPTVGRPAMAGSPGQHVGGVAEPGVAGDPVGVHVHHEFHVQILQPQRVFHPIHHRRQLSSSVQQLPVAATSTGQRRSRSRSAGILELRFRIKEN